MPLQVDGIVVGMIQSPRGLCGGVSRLLAGTVCPSWVEAALQGYFNPGITGVRGGYSRPAPRLVAHCAGTRLATRRPEGSSSHP